ncbi:uncharacterized protein LOC141590668 [Silene latifolia]|uniref:uncharacterized protein LOC141590668 n=1 Tax=Silene latifolia TaxID=37657 RepID=UPI003D77B6D4
MIPPQQKILIPLWREKLRKVLGYDGHFRVDTIGFSGGIWLYWRTNVVDVSLVTKHHQFLTVEVTRLGENLWFFTAVYASPNPSNRKELWSELEYYARQNNQPWLLAGDFNETRTLAERHGGDVNMARRCDLFNNWIENCELIELEFSGPCHTWARGNSLETRQSARLDRALCNSEWSVMFSDASVKHLPAFQSDHCCQHHLSIRRTSNLIKLEANLRKELDEILEREEILWYQKSRVEFLKDGDRNTSYFHVSTLVRRWRNRITSLKNDQDVWVISDPDKVKQLVVEYYKKLYTDDTPYDASSNVPYDLFQEFNNEQWDWITRYYSTAEIEKVIFQMGSLKALVPDEFQALFYQKHWDTVRNDVCAMAMKALEGKGLPTGINDTHIVLIPKVTGPEYISQFRPISLCNVVYKIVSKVIANRIKKVLPFRISENQSGFVPGRQISDNIVVFQETIHTMKKKRGNKGLMAIKIDLEKAYDRLKWDFIRDTLLDMHFPTLMVDTVMECVTSATMQILWNGEPSEKFKPTRGVRQGDPLSSYLFVMCLEKLQQAIDVEVRDKNWKPIPICKDGPLISNLFFADDMVLFAEANITQAQVIKEVLDHFCQASGEKVSTAKSKIFFSSNTTGNDQEDISSLLGFDITDDLVTYLGVPTINGRVTRATFAHLEEKFNKRLAGWQTKHISLAGRATLVQSTLSTLANYYMQTAKIPRSRPKNAGGLGIRSARQSNAAFLTKLGWRVLTEPSSLWARVLRTKYCNGRCDVNMFQPRPNMSNVWAGITSQANILQKGAMVAVGNGRTTLFWDHAWVDEGCLADKAILNIPESILGATVSDMWDVMSGWKWDLFSNYLPREELLKIEAYSLATEPYIEDALFWGGTPSGKFSIKSALVFMRADETPPAPATVDWHLICKLPVQQRIRMFIWLSSHNRIMCNYNRVRRGLSDDPLCPRCLTGDETTDHLLRSCPFSTELWMQLGMPLAYDSFFYSSFTRWVSDNVRNTSAIASNDWPMKSAIVCWWIWKWRNNVVFGRGNENPTDPVRFLHQQFDTSKNAFDPFSLFSSSHGTAYEEILVRWHPPPFGWFLLNTDSASKGKPGPAGCGGIIRDDTGNFVSAYFFSCGVCNSMRAEMRALLAGLEHARSLRITKLLVHKDNSTCVDFFQKDQLLSHGLRPLVQQCKELIKLGGWPVKIDHSYREANRAADWLANEGVTSVPSVTVLSAPPHNLRSILREDVLGVSLSRVVAS